MIMYKILYNLTGGDVDRSYVRCMLIYRGCLLLKNSFVNISEVNRQCLHSLGSRSEDDFEKVSIFTVQAFVLKRHLSRPGICPSRHLSRLDKCQDLDGWMDGYLT